MLKLSTVPLSALFFDANCEEPEGSVLLDARKLGREAPKVVHATKSE